MIRFVTDIIALGFFNSAHANFFKNLRKVLHQVSFETLTSLNSENGKKKFKKDVHVRSKVMRVCLCVRIFFFSFFYAHKVNFKADEMYLLLHKNSRNLISRLQRHNTATILLSNVD